MVQSISLTNGAKHITYDWCKAYHLRMVQSISLKNGAEHITYEWCRAYHLRMVQSISLTNGAEHITYEEVEQVFEQCPFYCGNILLVGF